MFDAFCSLKPVDLFETELVNLVVLTIPKAKLKHCVISVPESKAQFLIKHLVNWTELMVGSLNWVCFDKGLV